MILVTGASGLSGSRVVREFARRNEPVRALVRDRARASETSPAVEIVQGDMLRPETLGGALAGVDRVLLVSSANATMFDAQRAFIDACAKAGVRHVIKFSGKEAGIGFDQGRFRFTRMHAEIEQYLERSGLAWTHLRPNQFMEVYLREAPTIAAQGAMLLPFGGIRLSPVAVEDIAKVAFALLHDGACEGKAYEMTGPEALTMTEIAQRISEAIGKPVRYVPVAPEERRRALLARGTPPDVVDALDEQTAERLRRPESRVYLGTHERFGVRPTPFAEFASRNAAAFRGDPPRS